MRFCNSMEISNDRIIFGQRVPTLPLLKVAFNSYKFEDAKILNNSLGITCPGHQGFYKKASIIANRIKDNNPEYSKLLDEIKLNFSGEINELKLKSISENLGEYLDLNV